MIPSRQEIAYRVYGAWRLARLDAGGAQYFDAAPEAALRSFFAAVLVGPAFLATLLLLAPREPYEANPLAIGLVIVLGYSLLWTVYPVIVHRICQVIDREQAFFRYLGADNWASIIGYHFQLAVLLLVIGGVVPAALAPLVQLAMHAYLLVYSWFIVRSCLDVTGPAAAGFVALQFAVLMMIQLIVRGILYPELS